MPLSLALRDVVRNLFLMQKILKILKEMYITGITITTGKKPVGQWSAKLPTPNKVYIDVVNRQYQYFFTGKFKNSTLTVPRQ